MKLNKNNLKIDFLRDDSGNPYVFGKNSITSIFNDSKGNVWVGTGNSGLFLLAKEGNSFTNLIHFNTISFYEENSYFAISFISEDTKGNIWIGTNRDGLVMIPYGIPNENKFIFYRNPIKQKHKTNKISIAQSGVIDKEGFIWFGTDGNGIFYFNNKTNEFESNTKDISGSSYDVTKRIRCLFIDKEGLLWGGTYGNGVFKINNNKPKFNYSHIISLEGQNTVWSLQKSRETDIYWAGLNNEIVSLQRQEKGFKKISEHQLNISFGKTIQNLQVRDVFEDEVGHLWIATIGLGLMQLDPVSGHFSIVNQKGKNNCILPSSSVYDIEYKDGLLWLAVNDGSLTSYNLQTKEFKEYFPEQITNQKFFNTFVKSAEKYPGFLWIGFWNYGLAAFDTRTESFLFLQYDPGDKVKINEKAITAIFEDDSTLWAGTYGHGLYRMDFAKDLHHIKKIKTKTYKQNNGNDFIYGILKSQNHLWLSTSTGIVRFDPIKEIFTNFDKNQGLSATGFNLGATLKEDTLIVFGGGQNLYYFNPEKIYSSNNKPDVILTGFNRFGKPDPQILSFKQREINISHTDNFISFEFAALSYINPEKNIYSYMLEGFDKSWVNSKNNNEAIYSNLEPGNYIFHVKAANSEGVWNQDGLSVALIIHQPFWEKWWFYTIVLVVIITGLYTVHRILLAETLKIKSKLEGELTRNFHDETGGYLANIRMNCYNLVHGKKEFQQKLLSQINNQSDYLSSSIKDLLFELDPEKSSLLDLMIYLKDHSDKLFKCTSISFDIIGLEDIHKKVWLHPRWKTNLSRIFKEGMNNILKHCEKCEKVTLLVILDRNRIEILLEDDGPGFDPTIPGKGNGIQNFYLRAKEIRGKVDVVSGNGMGTKIKFTGKLPYRTVVDRVLGTYFVS